MATQHKALTVTGWILTVLVVGMLAMSAGMKLKRPPEMMEMFVDKLGYPEDVINLIAILEISSAIIFLIPQTSVLGAVLLTGYLGGAVATHVRVHDNPAGPIIGGVLVWLALFLRDPRIRELLPIRRSAS